MKVSLVVASGAHQGKVIPITGPQFLIGRDPQCHLRPASQAISKQHCGIVVRDGKVYVKDFGSTNGTTVNEVLVKGAEVQIVNGASVKLGPLDFIVRVETTAPARDGTPLPTSPEGAAALAAVKAVSAAAPKAAPPRDVTPNPAQGAKPAKPGTPTPTATKDGGSKGTPAPKVTKPTTPLPPDADDNDKIAALLMGMDDGEDVPDGSTVTDLKALQSTDPGDSPAPGGQPAPGAAKPDDKAKKPALAQTREEMSNAASEILKMMRNRPK